MRLHGFTDQGDNTSLPSFRVFVTEEEAELFDLIVKVIFLLLQVISGKPLHDFGLFDRSQSLPSRQVIVLYVVQDVPFEKDPSIVGVRHRLRLLFSVAYGHFCELCIQIIIFKKPFEVVLNPLISFRKQPYSLPVDLHVR